MGWIWSSKKSDDVPLARPHEPVQHTRFAQKHSRAKPVPIATTNAALEARTMAAYSLRLRNTDVDGPISVNVLQRALPNRFPT